MRRSCSPTSSLFPTRWAWGLYFADGEGPRFERPLRDEWEIRDLTVPDPHEHLSYVLDAVAQIRRALANEVPLIGFSGSPFTLACYMIEGRGGTEFHEIKRMLYAGPICCTACWRSMRSAVIAYLNAQIEAGAQAVMVFDTWGGALSHAAYQEFSLRYHAASHAGPDAHIAGRDRASHRVHQGRRSVAGEPGRHRRRRAGPGLDHGHRRGARARR